MLVHPIDEHTLKCSFLPLHTKTHDFNPFSHQHDRLQSPAPVHPPLWRIIVHIVFVFLGVEPSPLTLPPIPIIRAILCRIRNARAPLIVSLTSSHPAMHCPDSEQRITMFDCQFDVVRFPRLGLFPQRHDSWLEISVAVGAPSA